MIFIFDLLACFSFVENLKHRHGHYTPEAVEMSSKLIGGLGKELDRVYKYNLLHVYDGHCDSGNTILIMKVWSHLWGALKSTNCFIAFPIDPKFCSPNLREGCVNTLSTYKLSMKWLMQIKIIGFWMYLSYFIPVQGRILDWQRWPHLFLRQYQP